MKTTSPLPVFKSCCIFELCILSCLNVDLIRRDYIKWFIVFTTFTSLWMKLSFFTLKFDQTNTNHKPRSGVSFHQKWWHLTSNILAKYLSDKKNLWQKPNLKSTTFFLIWFKNGLLSFTWVQSCLTKKRHMHNE